MSLNVRQSCRPQVSVRVISLNSFSLQSTCVVPKTVVRKQAIPPGYFAENTGCNAFCR